MASDETKTAGLLDSATQAAKTILETVKEDGFVHVFSHLDADGVAAAGIIGKMLARLDAKFRVRITQWIDEKIVGEILADKPQLIILADFGSGYVDLLNEKLADFRIVILDHHQVTGKEASNIVHVNPHLYGADGARDISGSGVAYFVAKTVDKVNVDLAPIAVVGALGDLQDKYDQRLLGGLNEIVVKDAVDAGLLTVEKDLIFFGRETRPIHKTLSSTTNPFIPGISGEEDKSLAFLASLDIKPRHGERWRALRDLSDEEKKRLCTGLADYLLSKGLHYEVTNLIGHVYTLNNEEPWTPLRDAREFAVLLNATGRMDRPSLGVAICMGDRGVAFEEANKVLEEYRRTINRYLGWVMEKPERIREFENIYVVYGEDFIDDKIVGAISSILSASLPNPEKPLIAYANVAEEGLAKFSARTVDTMTNKGVNLGVVMQVAAEKYGGNGGGHNIAAGAQVPIENVPGFVVFVNELLGRQLRGEKIGS
ncbi:MAG: DHH family phosphoesterase [Candidatus Bathyarchaeota archaeon]|jgi:RecJ-like exonuclease|nr:DHH family phosphoesterase [Candidatus Bathyarchaeota archaeon A05DMB-5]MDH7557407.1 DHH family phosphoesterase [Candidatus Bathyarchaeota archaeon]